jgi:hypothetical protein
MSLWRDGDNCLPARTGLARKELMMLLRGTRQNAPSTDAQSYLAATTGAICVQLAQKICHRRAVTEYHFASEQLVESGGTASLACMAIPRWSAELCRETAGIVVRFAAIVVVFQSIDQYCRFSCSASATCQP